MSSVLTTVMDGNLLMLRMMLQTPQALEQKDLNHSIIYSAKHGLLQCASYLVDAGVDVECEDASGNQPLHHSVAANQVEMTKFLLEANANPNVIGLSRCYPLHIASKGNMTECMEHLVEHKAKLDARDSAGQTPLIVATRERCFCAVKFLLARGCNIDCQDKSGRTALHYASQNGTGVDILLAAGANTNMCDVNNCTPLLLASTEGFSHVVKLLCHANCNPNIANHSVNKTPLHILSFKGHSDCINDLLLAGADVNFLDSEFRTPLWYAVSNWRLEVVKILLKANSQVDTYQCHNDIPEDACPVRLAITKGNSAVLKMFIVSGFDACHLRENMHSTSDLPVDLVTELCIWLHNAHQAMTLKQLCRRWIRHHQGIRLFHDLSLMPIPQGLRDFLLLKELDDIHPKQ
ncbi:ankyrin repeat, PH and SEC7 domain containing protein secG-like isoform X1 [Haliotis cracherodii]|uniref:ankyrin repeat, PH and SEC7 domain containing protein secG-like isoform X1 n=2 Tax=Haliotis cracherodii TaxID=6455 RepID=UPI0039EBA54D